MNICEHFLSSFNHVIRAQVYVEEVPWKRFEKVTSVICALSLIKEIGFMTYTEILLETIFFSNFQNGVKHVHAFIHTPTGTHFCEVEQMRGGEKIFSCFDSAIAISVFYSSKQFCLLALRKTVENFEGI